MSIGAIYVITRDERYVNLLRASVESLKGAMPDLPITVFSEFPVTHSALDRVIPIKAVGDGFYDKARMMLDSPYEKTIFLDADIYVAEAFPEVFALLERFDCAATHEEYLNTDWSNYYPRPDVPESFPEFNTGVLVYRRSSAMHRTLQEWGRLYREYLEKNPGQAINDQPFFRIAAYFGDARIATLGREYNCKFRGQGYLNGKAKLLHGHVRFKMNPIYMRSVAALINASDRPRVYVAGNVYEQRVSGRLFGRRQARKVGSFSEPEPMLNLRAKKLRERIKSTG
jgi:hypothetical protein